MSGNGIIALMKRKNTTTVHIAAAVWFSAVCSLFLISHRKGLMTLNIILCLINLFLYYRQKPEHRKLLSVLSLLCLITAAVWLIMGSEYAWYASCILSSIYGTAELIRYLKLNISVWKRSFTDDKIYWLLHLGMMTLLMYGFVRLSLLSFQPDDMVRRMNPQAANITEYAPVTEEEYAGDFQIIRNIQYDTEYPNSVFDLMRSGKENAPLFVWFHGGGFISGSRDSEDRTQQFFAALLKEGYDIVSADYALAPDYRYPVPLIQAERLFLFLQDHQDELQISTNSIVCGGTGAGAEIVIQYLCAAYNPAYASETGLTPVAKEQLKAAYLVSACYQPQYSDETNYPLTDFIMYQQSRSYYSCFSLHESKDAKRADCTAYITDDFPPLLIADGNTGTYTVQAHRMDDLLTERGIYHETDILDAPANNKNLIGISFDTEYNTYGVVHGKFLQMLRDIRITQ